MTKFQRSRIALAIAALLGLGVASVSAQTASAPTETLSMRPSYDTQPVAANASFALVFAQPFPYTAGRYTVMVGSEDVTVNFARGDANTLQGDFARAALPAGEAVIKVFGLSADNEWALLAQVPITVQAPPGGARRDLIKPSGVLSLKAQPWEQHSLSATPPNRHAFADATLQAGLETDHGNDVWGLRSSVNIVGSSYAPEALQYGSRGAGAAKVDLARYLVEGSYKGTDKNAPRRSTRFALGHVQAGDHPLLASGIANRGVVLQQQFGERAELTLSSQSSTALLGTQNVSGLADAANRFDVATVAYELLPRAGALRVEATGFNGGTLALPSPGISPPPVPERSRGWGLRLRAASEDGRWRGELAYAQSASATLLGDGSSGAQARHAAYVVDLSRDIVQGHVLAPALAEYPLSLTATLRRERTQPGYHSLGASTNADALSNNLGLNGSLGPASAGLTYGSHEDNLAGDASRPRNLAPAFGATLQLPLATLLDAGAPKPWWPAIDYAYSRNHDHADPGRVPTGSTVADLSDTLATSHRLGLNWTIKTLSLGYAYSRMLQDNRQPGYELDDNLSTGHDLTASWAAREALILNGAFGWHLSTPLKTGVQTRGLTVNAGLQWALSSQLKLAASANYSDTRDAPYTSSLRTLGGDLMLSRGFTLPLGAWRVPGQWSLRYAFNDNAARDATQPAGVPVRYQVLHAGASLAF